MDEWETFLKALKEAGGSTDMQTSKTGRYPWLFHFCRGQATRLDNVEIFARVSNYPKPTILVKSPPRDWRTEESILADYKALKEHGGVFNDTTEALSGKDDELRALEHQWRVTSGMSAWIRWAKMLARTGDSRPLELLKLARRGVRYNYRLHRLAERIATTEREWRTFVNAARDTGPEGERHRNNLYYMLDYLRTCENRVDARAAFSLIAARRLANVLDQLDLLPSERALTREGDNVHREIHALRLQARARRYLEDDHLHDTDVAHKFSHACRARTATRPHVAIGWMQGFGAGLVRTAREEVRRIAGTVDYQGPDEVLESLPLRSHPNLTAPLRCEHGRAITHGCCCPTHGRSSCICRAP